MKVAVRVELNLLLRTYQGKKAGVIIHADMTEIRVQTQRAHGTVIRGRLFAFRVRQAAGETLRVGAPLRPPVIGGYGRCALCRNLRHVTPRLAETGKPGAAKTIESIGESQTAPVQVTGSQVDISPITGDPGQTR